MENFQEKFGIRVKQLRKKQNMTQEKLAEALGIGVRSIGKIETGKSFPSAKNIEKLIITLQTSPIELFNFEYIQPKSDIKKAIIEILEQNPAKLSDIYKIVKAMTM